MHLYCPTCQTSFASAVRCPRCDGRLVTPSEVFESRPDLTAPPPDPIRPTAAARVVVGGLVAVGSYLGLREWATAGLQAVGAAADGGDPWDHPAGWVLAVLVNAAAVLAGAVVAGAGRPNGAVTGAVVGLVCGGAAAAAGVARGGAFEQTEALTLAGLTALAAAAGWVGARVWPPAADLPAPVPKSRGSSLLRLAKADAAERAARPTKWVRVLLGATAAVLAVAAADGVRDGLKRAPSGMLRLGGPAQVPTVCLEIAGFLVAAAAAVAAGGTGSGLRHGLFTGALAGLGVAGMVLGDVDAPLPVVEGVLEHLGLPTGDLTSPTAAMAAGAAVVTACVAGGWLGGTLLPPVERRRKKKHRFDDGV